MTDTSYTSQNRAIREAEGPPYPDWVVRCRLNECEGERCIFCGVSATVEPQCGFFTCDKHSGDIGEDQSSQEV
jgi:hypothetical protein